MATGQVEQVLYTPEQAAEVLQKNAEVLRRMARGGGIPAVKIGKRWYFNKRELEEWATANNGYQAERS